MTWDMAEEIKRLMIENENLRYQVKEAAAENRALKEELRFLKGQVVSSNQVQWDTITIKDLLAELAGRLRCDCDEPFIASISCPCCDRDD